jgi:hypothetical protein
MGDNRQFEVRRKPEWDVEYAPGDTQYCYFANGPRGIKILLVDQLMNDKEIREMYTARYVKPKGV